MEDPIIPTLFKPPWSKVGRFSANISHDALRELTILHEHTVNDYDWVPWHMKSQFDTEEAYIMKNNPN